MEGVKQLKLSKKLAIRKVEDTYLIVTIDNVLHEIDDPVGVFILDRLNEQSWTMDDLWKHVESSFDVSQDPLAARMAVEDFLKNMAQKGIIER